MIGIKLICGLILFAMGLESILDSFEFDVKYYGLVPKIDFIRLFLGVSLWFCIYGVYKA